MTELDPGVTVDAVCAYSRQKVRARYLPKDKHLDGINAYAVYPGGVVTRLGDLGQDWRTGEWEFMAEEMFQKHSAMDFGANPYAVDFWDSYRGISEEHCRVVTGPLWEKLPEITREQVLEAHLCCILIPESPASDRIKVLASSNCLETYLRDRIFNPFRRSKLSQDLRIASPSKAQELSLTTLKIFVQGRDEELSLGSMARILRNLGAVTGAGRRNGFSIFLQELLKSSKEFFTDEEIPERLTAYAKKYRNPAVHPVPKSESDWSGAWLDLVSRSRPKGLLVSIESLIRSAESTPEDQ